MEEGTGVINGDGTYRYVTLQIISLKKKIYLFLQRGEGREEEAE